MLDEANRSELPKKQTRAGNGFVSKLAGLKFSGFIIIHHDIYHDIYQDIYHDIYHDIYIHLLWPKLRRFTKDSPKKRGKQLDA